MLTSEQRKELIKLIDNSHLDTGSIAVANRDAGQFSNKPAGITVPAEIQGSILDSVFNPLADLIVIKSKEIMAKDGVSFEIMRDQIKKLIQSHVDLRTEMEKAIKESTEQELIEYKALQQQNKNRPTERMKELEGQINKKIARIAHIGEAVVADLTSHKSDLGDVAKNFRELYQNEFSYEAGQQPSQPDDELEQQYKKYQAQLGQLRDQILKNTSNESVKVLVLALVKGEEDKLKKIKNSDDNPAVKVKRMAGSQAESTAVLNLILDILNIINESRNTRKEGKPMTITVEDRQVETYNVWLDDRLKKTAEMYTGDLRRTEVKGEIKLDRDASLDSERQKGIYKDLVASLKGVTSHVTEEARRVSSQTAQTEQTQRISYEAGSESTKALKSPTLFERFAARFNFSSSKSNQPPARPAIMQLQDAMTAASSKYSDHITVARKPEKAELSEVSARIRQKEGALGATTAPDVVEPKQPSGQRHGKR